MNRDILFTAVGGSSTDPGRAPKTFTWSWFARNSIEIADEHGINRLHIHNPFGHYDVKGRWMHPDQWSMAGAAGLNHLRRGFRPAMRELLDRFETVCCYIGAPKLLWEPGNSPTDFVEDVLNCCQPLIDAGVREIGFDNTYDDDLPEEPGLMLAAIKAVESMGVRVTIEPSPPAAETELHRLDVLMDQRFYFKQFAGGQSNSLGDLATSDQIAGEVKVITITGDDADRVRANGHTPLRRRGRLGE